ncbi:SPOR domain-containing protein [Hydrogenophaga sp.]|uniref:SPOR domain-containing protein n=1 Tax=Hydrogenophaga sp. TaxID=1904254 RepID=UPI002605A9D9|nr:SPOR domain-containing protein [Hydrogenophaga sp.]MCW5654981.1 SPOR domain-containing protein [Hydrogenophaga sp.]
MLKWAIWLLALANAGYFAWGHGYLRGLGLAPLEQREPQRLDGQVHPEQLRLLNGPKAQEAPAPTPAPVSAPASTDATTPAAAAVATGPQPAPAVPPMPDNNGPRACWQAGGFTEAQAELLRAELKLLGLPADRWQLVESRSAGRWIVYMGRYDNEAQLERKKAELRGMGVSFRDVSGSGLAPGLALGTYSSEAAAQQALQQVERNGVRTAKVTQERAESVSYTLRLPAITAAQRTAVDGLGDAMAGKSLRACS